MTRVPAHEPATASKGGARALLAPAAVLAGVAAGVAVVAAVDPHEPGHYPTCPFLAISGLYCPGCGGLRMVNSLAHGQFGTAFGSNQFLFLMLPLAVWLWGVWAVQRARGTPVRSILLRPSVGIALVVLAALYWVVRNLPFAHVLAP